MKVLDHEHYSWFLLEKAGSLYFDTNCNNSFVGYSVLIKLSPDEQSKYTTGGREYLSKLAHEIHYSAPIVEGSKSPYKKRIISGELNQEVSLAIKQWRESGRN